MKKIFSFLLALVILAALLPMTALAAETEENVSYIYFEDGSYLVITITEYSSRAHTTKSAAKNYNYYDISNKLCWTATLSGSFSYDGTVAVCNSASCNVTIHDNIYALSSKSASKRGNTAYATIYINLLFSGAVVETTSHSMTLTCDKNGNFS